MRFPRELPSSLRWNLLSSVQKDPNRVCQEGPKVELGILASFLFYFRFRVLGLRNVWSDQCRHGYRSSLEINRIGTHIDHRARRRQKPMPRTARARTPTAQSSQALLLRRVRAPPAPSRSQLSLRATFLRSVLMSAAFCREQPSSHNAAPPEFAAQLFK